MKIFFFAGKCIPVHAKSLEERPLGGTETGLIRVAELLAHRGHDVTVFTSHTAPPEQEEGEPAPRYLPAGMVQHSGSCDVLVAVQDWWSVFYGVDAKKRVYWTGDGPDQFMTFGIGDTRIRNKIDLLCAVSTWHAEHLCRASGFPRERTTVLWNGVHLPWFQGEEERDRFRLLYTSAPYRGLDLAVKYFSVLKEKYPDLSLHAFTGFKLYDRDQPVEYQEKMKREYQKLKVQLEAVPGVVLHENVTQAELAREYMKSGLFFYPATVPETFCITALEAQAGGCPVVTSAIGALEETVGDAGLAIHGTPGSEPYGRTFIEAADRILSDGDAWERLSKAALTRVGGNYSWAHVADRFESVLTKLLGQS